MQKVLFSLLLIGVVAAMAGAGTLAYFSDTETSSGNTFTAGTLDLKVDWDEYYNGELIETQDETDDPGPIFNLNDVKPGDYGEVTISLHVYGNDAYGKMTITPTSNDDVSSTEPELDAGDEEEDDTDDWDGELAQNMEVVIWWDMYDEGGTDVDNDGMVEFPGDNIQDETETVLYEGTAPLETVEIVFDADPTTDEIDPLEACTTYYIGIKWSIGSGVGNIIQSDKYTADISFYTVQARHNPVGG